MVDITSANEPALKQDELFKKEKRKKNPKTLNFKGSHIKMDNFCSMKAGPGFNLIFSDKFRGKWVLLCSQQAVLRINNTNPF